MNITEVLRIIEKNRAEEVKWLDLSENKMQNLPPEIGQLSNLTTLDLGFNELKICRQKLVS